MPKLHVPFGAAALLSVALLSAQTPPTPPTPAQSAQWRVSHLTTILSLTTEQQTQATTIFTTEATTAAGLRSSLQTAHKAIEAAIETNDTATIAAEAAQIGTLTGQEVQARATADAAFYAILTADQQTKYKAIHSQGPGFGHGPGMRHGGGDGPVPPPPGD